MDASGHIALTVAYEKTTERKKMILRTDICDDVLQELDELRAMIIKNCSTDIKTEREHPYSVLTLEVKE